MSASNSADTQWFGHPRGLSTLFFTELWERLSYYGMRGILVLFMVDQMHGLQMDRASAAAIYGLYTAGVYVLALPGGWVADRLIGQRQAVFYGGIIIALGHFTLAVPGSFFFYLGLILIVIGTGLLKPNVSAIVGDLYPEGGGRRDAGFSIFYMGINVGAFAGPLLCGWLGEKVNWHYGFAAAGVGMVFGVIQYRMGEKYLGDAGTLRTPPAELPAVWRKFYIGLGILLGIIALLFVLDRTGVFPISLQAFAQGTTYLIVGLAVSYFAYQLLFGGLDSSEKKRLLVIFLMFVGAALFWSGFEQAGSSMNLFSDDKTDRSGPLISFVLIGAVLAMLFWLARKAPRAVGAAALFSLFASLLVQGFRMTGLTESMSGLLHGGGLSSLFVSLATIPIILGLVVASRRLIAPVAEAPLRWLLLVLLTVGTGWLVYWGLAGEGRTFETPASWLQSVNPMFIIALAPIFGWIWIALASRNPSIPTKFGLGLGLLGLGFVVLRVAASQFETNGALASPWWLISTYFLHTCGELCLSPVGLSSVTKLSPKRLVGQMMGIWFMGAALGNLIAGLARRSVG